MIKDKYRYLILGFVLGTLSCYWWFMPKETQSNLYPNMSNSTSGLLSTTSVQVVPKSSPGEEDLIVSQKYTAVINGEKVSVPIVKATTNSDRQPGSPSGDANVAAQDNQVSGTNKVIVSQAIDMTPVLSKLKPTWELGLGYNYLDNKHYGCVSIQRNYKKNKALDLTCQIRDNQVKGIMVQHKWLLH